MASFCYILLIGCSGLAGFLILGHGVVALYEGMVGHYAQEPTMNGIVSSEVEGWATSPFFSGLLY